MLTIEKRFYQTLKVIALMFMIVSGFGALVLITANVLNYFSNIVHPSYSDAIMKYALVFILMFSFYKYLHYKQCYIELKHSIVFENKQ